MIWLIRILVIIHGLSALSFLYSNSFTTLAQAQVYAKENPELVKPENDDWLIPRYTLFHEKMLPNMFQRLWMRLGFSTKRWDARAFERLLRELIASRQKDEHKTDFSERFTPHAGDKFIIWGDLYSAFHSLIRDLTFLQQRNIIDNNLKIASPYYFIFNGNVTNGTPYGLETLTLVFQLMKQNPTRVIYTRGYYEVEERWQNFELMDEFITRFGESSEKYKEMATLLSKFFLSLPLGLYLTQETKQSIDVVVISSNRKVSQRFDDRSLAGLVDVHTNPGFFYYKKNDQVHIPKKNIHLRAFITGEDRSISYHLTEGLTMIGAIEGATRWMVFSSPTERNKNLYQFNHDAFTQLNISNNMNKWTIALFNQKASELKGFSKTAVYNLISGHTVRGKNDVVAAKDFFFGSTMDLSKGASPIGKRVEEGLNLAFDKARSEKIIAHIMPRLTTVNDEYTPQKTRAAVEDLIARGIKILIGSQGSASLESYLDLIEDEKVLVLFPFTGAPEFRKPNLSHLIHYRGSYIREGEELVKYALKSLRARKIAIFYQDDAFGRGALEGARRALKNAGISNFLEVPHERNVINYAKQAVLISDFNPDTIFFLTNTLPIRGLIHHMGVQYFAGKNLLGLSVYEDAFERYLKDIGLSFVLTRMVPDPKVSNLPIAKEYRKWADAYNLSYDKVSFEQFINATILFEILHHIKPPITKEKIIAFAENMKNYPLFGLTLNFNPETRELSDILWIDPGNGREWIKQTGVDTKKKIAVEQLRFGSLMDLSKGIRSQGRAVKAGIELRLQEDRDDNNKIPTITIVDDQYDPKITRREVEKFIKEKINIFVCPLGSPTLESYLDLVEKGEVTVLFPMTGAPIFRNQKLTTIINLRVSYATEAKVLSEYALDQLKSKKIILFYQNDAFGKGLLGAAQAVFKERNFVDVLDIPYERNSAEFTAQVEQARAYKPDTILFFSTAPATRNFIRQYGVKNVAAIKMAGNSDLGETAFINFAKETGLSFIYLNVVPNPEKSDLPIVKQYRDQATKKNQVVDIFSLEAYICVDILLAVLHNIKGEITKEKIMNGLSSYKAKDYKGLMLNFDPATRTLLHSLWLSKGTADWQIISTN